MSSVPEFPLDQSISKPDELAHAEYLWAGDEIRNPNLTPKISVVDAHFTIRRAAENMEVSEFPLILASLRRWR